MGLFFFFFELSLFNVAQRLVYSNDVVLLGLHKEMRRKICIPEEGMGRLSVTGRGGHDQNGGCRRSGPGRIAAVDRGPLAFHVTSQFSVVCSPCCTR